MCQHFAFSMLKGTPAQKKYTTDGCGGCDEYELCITIHIYKNQPSFITLCWCIKLELFFCYQRFLPAQSLLTILQLFCFLPKILQNIRSSVWVVVVGLLYKFHKCHRVNPSSEQRADNITLRERERENPAQKYLLLPWLLSDFELFLSFFLGGLFYATINFSSPCFSLFSCLPFSETLQGWSWHHRSKWKSIKKTVWHLYE